MPEMHLLVRRTPKDITTKCGLTFPPKKGLEVTTIWGDRRVDCMGCRPYEWVRFPGDIGYKMVAREEYVEGTGEVWGEVDMPRARPNDLLNQRRIVRKRTTEPERRVVRRRRVG